MIYSIVNFSLLKTITIIATSLFVSLLIGLIFGLVWIVLNFEFRQSAYLRSSFQSFIISVPFGIIGVVSGFLTGASRDSAVAALVPGVLTFAGGIAAYLMAKGVRSTILITISVVSFSTLLLFGAIYGSKERELAVARQNSLESKLRNVEAEFAVRRYKRGLGIPLDDADKAQANPLQYKLMPVD